MPRVRLRRLRGELRGQPLSRSEHDVLYQRAMEGSRKGAADNLRMNANTSKHLISTAFAKLGVGDMTGAFFVMGWLHPLPYGARSAEVRHDRLDNLDPPDDGPAPEVGG